MAETGEFEPEVPVQPAEEDEAAPAAAEPAAEGAEVEATAEEDAGAAADATAEAADGAAEEAPPVDEAAEGDAPPAAEGEAAEAAPEGGEAADAPAPEGDEGAGDAAAPTADGDEEAAAPDAAGEEGAPAEEAPEALPEEASLEEPVSPGAAEEGDELPAEASRTDPDGRASPSGDESLPEGGIDSTMVDGLAGEEGEEEDDEEALAEMEEDQEPEGPDPLEELTKNYNQLLELNTMATHHNKSLQWRVIQRKVQDKSYDSEKQSEGKVTQHKYENVLHNVHAVRLRLRLQQVKAARMSDELKNQLEVKRSKAIECRDSFQEFKRQVARHAEYARTGKKIPEKIIQEVEEFELDKDAEVEEVRGSNISLKNRLAKLDQALRKKDELAENLHVIDFEQLKIENQTLNEKIEERNEELHKLRKKTIVTVQIITHMREKVQFVQQEYQVLKAELAQLDQDLAAQRDLVAKTKHERDEHRSEYGKLRQQTGIMNSEHLARDFDQRAEDIKKLKDEIAQLKKRHGQLLQFIKRHGETI